jgi:L-asparaginase
MDGFYGAAQAHASGTGGMACAKGWAMTDTTSPIHVLTTGGTIDKLYFDALSEYQIGESILGRLLETARVRLPVEIEEVLRKDSLDLTDADRALITSRVAQSQARRIVITHGTDTMTQTAQALAEALGADYAGKSIAFVGALAPARFSESDASFNLGMAFATVQVAQPGIYITMNGTVFRADEVTKDRVRGAFVAKDQQG